MIVGLFGNVVFANDEISVYLNGERLAFDVPPQIIDGRTMVPMRAIFEALGLEVEWNSEHKTIRATNDYVIVDMQVGNVDMFIVKYVDFDGYPIPIRSTARVELDVPPLLVDDRTLVPVRAISEGLGANVEWIDETRTVIITKVISAPTVSSAPQYDFVPQPLPPTGEYGNSTGNIINGGNVAWSGDWIFYNNGRDRGRLYKIRYDGTGREKLSDDRAESINVVGDWIFYILVDPAGLQQLYKIRTDGTDRQQIAGINRVSRISVVGDWIYFTGRDTGIQKIRTDGTERTTILNDGAFYKNVVGDWIYFSNWIDGFAIYKIRTDGTEKTKLNDDASSRINVVGDWIFYLNSVDGGHGGLVYKIRTDGTQRTRLSDVHCVEINVADGWIYYLRGARGAGDFSINLSGIHKMRTDGTEKTRLTNEASADIHVIGEWVYFTNNAVTRIDGVNRRDGRIFKIRIDGTGQQLID